MRALALAPVSAVPSPRRTAVVFPLRTLLLIAAVFGVGWAFASIRATFLTVFIGIFLALVFEGPVRIVERRTPLSRGLAATVVVIGSAAVIFVIGLLLFVPLASSVRDFLQGLPAIVEQLRASDVFSQLQGSDAGANVQSGAETIAKAVPDTLAALVGVAGEAASTLFAAFMIVFTALFLLTDVANLKRAAGSVMMPGDRERWLGIWERVTSTVSRWAVGVVVIATIAGLTQGLTAYLLGSSFALALGLLAGFCDMIPNIGATIAGFVLTLTLLAEEGTTAAVIMLLVVLIYQQVENNLLTPTIQGKAVELSGFFIITAVALFGALMGVLGAIVAVPIAATIQIVVRELTVDRRARVAAADAALAAAQGDGAVPAVAPAEPA